MKTIKSLALALSISALLGGCGGGSTVAETPAGFTVESGQAQKGPLLRGATITVHALSATTWAPNGASYGFQTIDNLGTFKPAKTLFNSQYLETVASGYYFNEVTGTTSTDIVMLRGLSDLSVDKAVNLNVLTDMSVMRMRTLMTRATGKLGFAAARAQTTRELLNAFYIGNADAIMPGGSTQPASFNELDLGQSRNAEQMLAAISALVVNVGRDGQGITAFLNEFELDLSDDGLINNSPGFAVPLRQRIDAAAAKLDATAVANNLNGFYRSTAFDANKVAGWLDSSGGIDQLIDRYKFSAKDVAAGTESRSTAYIAGTDEVGQCVSVTAGTLYRNGVAQPGAFKAVKGDSLVIGLLAAETGVVDAYLQRSAPAVGGTCPATVPVTGLTRLAKFSVATKPIGVVALAAGMWHSIAIKADGTLWAWGINSEGQLGDGTTADSATPKLIGSGFVAAAAGWSHTVAIKSDGTLWAWGGNSSGQLGDGTTTTRLTPVLIGSGYKAVASRNATTLGLKNDGTFWSWGMTLPDASGLGSLSPKLVDSGVTAITEANISGAIIKTDGSLWCWGPGAYGVLGNGTFNSSSVPVLATTGFSGANLSSGWDFNVALKPDGTVWAWGYNGLGQMGDGTTTNRASPVNAGSGFRSAAAGTHHVVAVKSDGSLWTWGNDLYVFGGGSEVGDPARYLPTQLAAGFTGVVAAGSGLSLAAKADGTVWSWGQNNHGQLGNGTTNTSATLVKVLLP